MCRHSRPHVREPEHPIMWNPPCFSPLAVHAPRIASPATVCAKPEQGDRAVVGFFSICRVQQELKPRNFGGSAEIRTRDQRIKSPLLYRLSYRPPFEEGRMLAATPPTVKLQSRRRTINAATAGPDPYQPTDLPRTRRSLPGVMPPDELISGYRSTLGIERRAADELLCRPPPKACSGELMT